MASQTKKIKRPSFVLKKDLILHTYDSFLLSQTRLFIQATSHQESESSEVNRRRELLLLDDLTSFAIAARRLVELTGLKSFANKNKIPMAFMDQSEEPYVVAKSSANIGFHTLMNRLIHASLIEHITDKVDFAMLFNRDSKLRERLMWNRILHHKVREPIEQLLFIASDEEDPVLISILDTIGASIQVAEKIIDVCSDQKIFLEQDYRGA